MLFACVRASPGLIGHVFNDLPGRGLAQSTFPYYCFRHHSHSQLIQTLLIPISAINPLFMWLNSTALQQSAALASTDDDCMQSNDAPSLFLLVLDKNACV